MYIIWGREIKNSYGSETQSLKIECKDTLTAPFLAQNIFFPLNSIFDTCVGWEDTILSTEPFPMTRNLF